MNSSTIPEIKIYCVWIIVFNYIEHIQFLVFYIDQLIRSKNKPRIIKIENAYILVQFQTLQRSCLVARYFYNKSKIR